MGLRERPWLLRGVVAGLAVVIAIVVLISFDDEDGTVAESAEPAIVTADELREAADGSEFPIYWAGSMAGKQLELTLGSDGSALVRYLASGTPVGGAGASSLSVGSYPLLDPEEAITRIATGPGAIVRDSGERQVVGNRSNPTSVYFADPDNRIEVEVYDPSAARALRLALSDRVQPVE